MKRRTGIVLALAAVVAACGAWGPAPAQAEEMKMESVQTQETIFGSQLMTEQERNQYRQRLMEAKTEQERERIRAEHHDQMMARAKERGVTLPEEPAMNGSEMMGGKGMGMEKSVGGGHPAGR